VTGLAARGGTLLIKGNTGYRVGIHMKEYAGTRPAVVIGGTSKDYLGEYMAGGTVVVLNLNGPAERSPVGMHLGAGYMAEGSTSRQGRGAPAGTGSDYGPVERRGRTGAGGTHLAVRAGLQDLGPTRLGEMGEVSPASSRPFSGHYDPTSI